jgi:hypothetical protein
MTVDGSSGPLRYGRLLDHGAIFNTRTASRAQVHVDAPGPFFDFDLEISGFAFHGFKVRIGDEFDVQMPADLDQYG